MTAAIVLILLILLVAISLSITFGLIKLAVMLFVAGLVGWLADTIVPGNLPYGWLGSILAGLVGSWLGTLLIGPRGPNLAGIHIIPALLGAIILAFVASLLSKGSSRRRF